MRTYIKNEILANACYRNELGQYNYTMITGFLLSHEIDFIENNIGFDVVSISNGYNMIVFKNTVI